MYNFGIQMVWDAFTHYCFRDWVSKKNADKHFLNLLYIKTCFIQMINNCVHPRGIKKLTYPHKELQSGIKNIIFQDNTLFAIFKNIWNVIVVRKKITKKHMWLLWETTWRHPLEIVFENLKFVQRHYIVYVA